MAELFYDEHGYAYKAGNGSPDPVKHRDARKKMIFISEKLFHFLMENSLYEDAVTLIKIDGLQWIEVSKNYTVRFSLFWKLDMNRTWPESSIDLCNEWYGVIAKFTYEKQEMPNGLVAASSESALYK